MKPEEIDNVFSYHAPQLGQPERYEAIREAAKKLAHVIVARTPPGDDQAVAVRKLRECVMTANAAIALEPPEER